MKCGKVKSWRDDSHDSRLSPLSRCIPLVSNFVLRWYCSGPSEQSGPCRPFFDSIWVSNDQNLSVSSTMGRPLRASVVDKPAWKCGKRVRHTRFMHNKFTIGFPYFLQVSSAISAVFTRFLQIGCPFYSANLAPQLAGDSWLGHRDALLLHSLSCPQWQCNNSATIVHQIIHVKHMYSVRQHQQRIHRIKRKNADPQPASINIFCSLPVELQTQHEQQCRECWRAWGFSCFSQLSIFYSCSSETIRWIPTGYCLRIDITGALVHYKGA